MRGESCGLGFDTDINTWKMVCHLLKEYAPPYKPDLVKKLKIYAQWCMYLAQTHGEKYPKSRLTQNQGKPYLLMAVCIGWPVILTSKPEMVEDKSSGWLIEHPISICALRRHTWSDHRLVNLNGEVGYVCTMTMEFSLL
ncbi:hypothetical protein Tco_0114628, partial [Tanacetum coccineum]